MTVFIPKGFQPLAFSTTCNRAFDSKYFYRAGSVLTAAIRSSAEQWATEKQAKSREMAGVER